MDPRVATLQSAVNRFAVVGGFPQVAVDGAWGPKTVQGVYSALSWIGQGKCYQTACAHEDMSKTAGGIVVAWDETSASAHGLAQFLGGVADELGLPHVAAPVPSGGGGGGGGPIVVPTSPYAMGLFDRFKVMPLWQQVAIGLVASLGLVFVVNRIRSAA